MCGVVGGQQANRNFDSNKIKPSSAPSCKANTDSEIRSGNVDIIKSNPNMPD